MSTSKVLPGDSNPRKWPASNKWPVEETGRNSVRPSIRPSTITCHNAIACYLDGVAVAQAHARFGGPCRIGVQPQACAPGFGAGCGAKATLSSPAVKNG